MTTRIPVTLNPRKLDGQVLNESQPGVSLGNGYCEMPFVYKGKEFKDSCYVTPKGEQWCATEVDEQGRHKYGQFGTCGEECAREKGNYHYQ